MGRMLHTEICAHCGDEHLASESDYCQECNKDPLCPKCLESPERHNCPGEQPSEDE